MPLTIGTLLGSHEIISLLGKGGMGEVYRARDTKLKREVAIKILPDEFSSDPSRVSRFQRVCIRSPRRHSQSCGNRSNRKNDALETTGDELGRDPACSIFG